MGKQKRYPALSRRWYGEHEEPTHRAKDKPGRYQLTDHHSAKGFAEESGAICKGTMPFESISRLRALFDFEN
ncbi:hypothetical protein AU467_31620 [Mesorhizobium loti]|uniref:Uncharacterized protein n=1 Tax=Rhizobium loti TaxID=381 RepID=A0A101KNG4_RHILI|nr:hypothetical protein AU467_31620 [Mesorhizobium loti]